MAAEGVAGSVQPGLPAAPGADRRRLVEQAVPLFLLAQAGEPGRERILSRDERFLAVPDRRVGAACR